MKQHMMMLSTNHKNRVLSVVDVPDPNRQDDQQQWQVHRIAPAPRIFGGGHGEHVTTVGDRQAKGFTSASAPTRGTNKTPLDSMEHAARWNTFKMGSFWGCLPVPTNTHVLTHTDSY